MSSVEINGLIKKHDKLFTENLPQCRGIQVYNEKLLTINGKEYRSWNPYRSKLAAALHKGIKNIRIQPDTQILYLGAATGTTVSHLSDIVTNGMVYAVESSPISMSKLLKVSTQRTNIAPLLMDANHPQRYKSFVPIVDILYQDISQRNQAEIFIKNMDSYLKKDGQGILMMKARSIDVALQPKKAYEQVGEELKKQGITITDVVELSPYEKDHAVLMATW
ncbi:MAG: fibrillarin-like rRNA/tRNA 2'-O-methyltransferase [Euryarchaeota archaeon]|nr:fibrillarin-like rRNA/tRNA 2'-O-methyltransferase [Euryarchaeota archaeon]